MAFIFDLTVILWACFRLTQIAQIHSSWVVSTPVTWLDSLAWATAWNRDGSILTQAAAYKLQSTRRRLEATKQQGMSCRRSRPFFYRIKWFSFLRPVWWLNRQDKFWWLHASAHMYTHTHTHGHRLTWAASKMFSRVDLASSSRWVAFKRISNSEFWNRRWVNSWRCCWTWNWVSGWDTSW